jgi:LmbE family N-acetylglucosaminyl deacetylase
MSKIIIVSSHPDDETLGAGGTLLRHKDAGDSIYWLIVTGIFEKSGFSKERIATRNDEIKKVTDAFEFEEVFLLNYPTMSLSGSVLLELVTKISEVFSKIQPNIIYTVNRSDAHSDHRVTFDAVMACTKSFRYPFIKKVLMYECLSETEFAPALAEKQFLPNYFVDVSDYLERKIEIMRIFESELGVHPFPRSEINIRALATYRGASAGVEFAEAFQLIKFIDK